MGKCTKHIGNIFDSTAGIICHQVNCQGVMGAGIAKEVKNRYPSVYWAYIGYCSAVDKKEDLLGCALILDTVETGGKSIANLFAQLDIKKAKDDKTVYTDYDALARSLDTVEEMAVAYGIKAVAVPYKMGCGLAGGDWNEVKKVLKVVFEKSPVDLEIWQLP